MRELIFFIVFLKHSCRMVMSGHEATINEDLRHKFISLFSAKFKDLLDVLENGPEEVKLALKRLKTFYHIDDGVQIIDGGDASFGSFAGFDLNPPNYPSSMEDGIRVDQTSAEMSLNAIFNSMELIYKYIEIISKELNPDEEFIFLFNNILAQLRTLLSDSLQNPNIENTPY